MTKLESQIIDLEKALSRLEEALILEASLINQDATIQRFEFSYELAWKIMQEKAHEAGQEVFGPKESIRVAVQLGLIENVELWFSFQKARNYSSHVYDQVMANYVYNTAKNFLPEAKIFLSKLKSS